MYTYSSLQLKLKAYQSQELNFFGVMPFTWNPKTKLYEKCDAAYWRFVFSTVLAIKYWLFLLTMSLHSGFNGKVDTATFVGLIFVINTLAVFLMCMGFLKMDEIIAAINIKNAYSQRLVGKYRIYYNPDKCWLNQVWGYLFIFNHLIFEPFFIAAMIAHHLTNPQTKIYYTYFITDMEPEFWKQKMLYYMVHVISAVQMVYLTAKIILSFSFIMELAVEAAIQLLPLLQNELFVGSKRTYKTKTTLREMANTLVEIRAITILIALLNQTGGILLLPASFLIGNSAVLANTIIIRYWKSMAGVTKLICIVATITMQICWIILVDLCRRLSKYSKLLLQSLQRREWGSKQNYLYVRKWGISCKPYRIAYGKLFIIRRKSVLTFVKNVYRKTFKALAALQKAK
ncbi:unnamed protein product [Orchesella dallaii]|uniref:Odorant receptor n=1 Tax=Orchesella dallaii TaxID=48710 RepID=A0ABP1S4B4_9HEXA